MTDLIPPDHQNRIRSYLQLAFRTGATRFGIAVTSWGIYAGVWYGERQFRIIVGRWR